MENFRLRPSDDYIKITRWSELFVLTNKWKSDLEFYNFELNFLNKLIGKYYIWLLDDEHIVEVEKISVKLSLLQKQNTLLISTVDKHTINIENIMENEFLFDGQIFREEHAKLEENIVVFYKDFKDSKKNVFIITEQVMETGHMMQLS